MGRVQPKVRGQFEVILHSPPQDEFTPPRSHAAPLDGPRPRFLGSPVINRESRSSSEPASNLGMVAEDACIDSIRF